MRYAINVYDWLEDLKNDKLTPQNLLLKNLIKGEPETVKCEGRRIDGDSILVTEDVTAEQWNATVELLRNKFERQKYKYRLYRSETGKGSWKRV